MSTVDSVVTCPQCDHLANRTFDCKASSTDTGCNYCGYTEYVGPEFKETASPLG